MVHPTVNTPPLQPPTSPQMARSGAASGSHGMNNDDDVDFGDSATHPLLKKTRPQDKSEIIQDILANSGVEGQYSSLRMNGDEAGADDEPPPRQAYPNTHPDDQTCVCHTGPLASFLCCLARATKTSIFRFFSKWFSYITTIIIRTGLLPLVSTPHPPALGALRQLLLHSSSTTSIYDLLSL